jgi:ElaB/YqjD/DUF883 family membrane-anchored ribosome-binding protein
MKSSSESQPASPNAAHELIADISQLMADAEEMLNESTSHHAEEKVALLNARHGEPDLMEKYISAKEKLSAIARRTDETIRACPYESLAVALGVGVLLGALLRRRAPVEE